MMQVVHPIMLTNLDDFESPERYFNRNDRGTVPAEIQMYSSIIKSDFTKFGRLLSAVFKQHIGI